MLVVNNLTVKKNGRTLVRDVSFTCQTGDIHCLLGPSGSGKTTIIRSIAGLDTPTAGCIHINQRCVADERTNVPIEKRDCGMMFQDLALFPHLNVAQNIGFGLNSYAPSERHARVQELLQLLNLAELARRTIDQLSGGQQQRVALARALAVRPPLLLLDEPLSSQDYRQRCHLLGVLKDFITKASITAILITHDQTEAFQMASYIGVLHNGNLLQWSSAYDIYHRPKNRFVAEFIAASVYIRGVIQAPNVVATDLGYITGEIQNTMSIDQGENSSTDLPPAGTVVDVLVRKDDIIHDDHSQHKAEVTHIDFHGSEYVYTLRIQNSQVLCSAPSHHIHHIGEKIGIRVEMHHLVLFLPAK